MSVTLSKQNSKFMHALCAILDGAVADKIEFEKAVISDDAADWQLFFSSHSPLLEDENTSLRAAVEKIVPKDVAVTIFLESAPAAPPVPPRPASDAFTPEEDMYAFVPPPEDAPAPEEDCVPTEQEASAAGGLSADAEDSALARYRERMARLSREAAATARAAA